MIRWALLYLVVSTPIAIALGVRLRQLREARTRLDAFKQRSRGL